MISLNRNYNNFPYRDYGNFLLTLLFNPWELSLYILQLTKYGYDFDMEFLKKYLDETDALDYMKMFGPCPELEYKLETDSHILYYKRLIEKGHYGRHNC